MKFFRKLIFRILILIVLLVGLGSLFRNSLGMMLAPTFLEKALGFPNSTAYLNLELLHPNLTLRELTLLNPPGLCNEPIAAKIGRVQIQYSPPSMIWGTPLIHQLDLDIDSVLIVKSKTGKVNWDAPPPKSGRHTAIKVTKLNLTLRSLTYIDEGSSGQPPRKISLKPITHTLNQIHTLGEVRSEIYHLILESIPQRTESPHPDAGLLPDSNPDFSKVKPKKF